MLNIEEINNTIEELENSPTTFEICLKLASLYIVRDKYLEQEKQDTNIVEQELNEIFPVYKQYCDIKRRYELGELTEEAVIQKMKFLCSEIKDFIQTLYSNTSFQQERDILSSMISELHF